MIVDFAGVPGSGKTTLAGKVAQELIRQGHPTQGLRAASLKVMSVQRPKIGFLQGKLERQNLYGLMLFAQAHPDLFEWLYKKSLNDMRVLLWNTEVMSQLGVLQKFGEPCQVVINDEGFVQRSASATLESGQNDDFETGIELIPRNIPIVFVKIDPSEALARISARGRGFHAALKGETRAETATRFQAYQDLLERGVACCQAAGTKTLVVDGAKPLEDTVTEIKDWLIPDLPAPIPVRKVPKARLERMAKKLAARKAGAAE
jgi:thymidylate kinase